MEIEKLTDSDFEQMKRIEQQLVATLLPFTTNTDPILGVVALTRVLRTMLRNVPREHQRTMRDLVEDFLRGRVTPRHEGLLWLPGEPKVN